MRPILQILPEILRSAQVGFDPTNTFARDRATLAAMSRSGPVKLLVRNARSRKFLNSEGHWTARRATACNFPNVYNAVHASLAGGAKDVELILRFEGDANDRRLTVRVG